jgi:hypothetical protein
MGELPSDLRRSLIHTRARKATIETIATIRMRLSELIDGIEA